MAKNIKKKNQQYQNKIVRTSKTISQKLYEDESKLKTFDVFKF